MRKRNKRWLLAAMGLVLFGISPFRSADVGAASPTGVLKQAIHWGISADWLDPATCYPAVTAHLPLYLLHDALLKPMPDGTYTPCLAESWTVSSDSKLYEFKLRSGVKFHNGDLMTAEDVVFSFWRYKAAQAKFIHGKTEKVEAVNPHLVRFHFKEPFPDFLEYVLPGASPILWVVPKKYVEKVGDAGFKKQPVGAGPYKFVEFVAGVRLVGEAFEGFWRKVPSVKRLEFQTVTELATRLAMVRRGEMDISTLIIDIFLEDAKKDPKLRVFFPISTSRWLLHIGPQTDPKSPWFDPRVRKAASLAIDRQTICDVQAGGTKPIGSLGMDGDPLAVHFPADPYDPERARKLLAEAGYPKGFHGGTYYPYNGPFWPQGEMIANYLKAVGITLDTTLLERPSWTAHRAGGKLKGSIYTETSGQPTIGGLLSYQLGTTSMGSHSDVEALWNQYQRETTPKVRKDLIARIQGIIRERTLVIPIRSSVTPSAVGPRVKGNPYRVQPDIWWSAPFEDLELAN